jgi:hypothetical protein
VPTAADPQTLNRYSYCNNNPINSTDPSGHDPITVAIITIVVAVAVNVAVAAATGGDIGKAALAGAVGAIVGLAVGFIASTAIAAASPGLSSAANGAIAGAAGGAAGGAASAAVSGGNVGMGALTGAIGGALGGATGAWTKNWGDDWGDIAARAAVSICTGSLGGGISAAIQGGNVWEGMAMGAAGAAAAFAAIIAVSGNADRVVNQVNKDTSAWASFGARSPLGVEAYSVADVMRDVSAIDGDSDLCSAVETAEAMFKENRIIRFPVKQVAGSEGYRYGEYDVARGLIKIDVHTPKSQAAGIIIHEATHIVDFRNGVYSYKSQGLSMEWRAFAAQYRANTSLAACRNMTFARRITHAAISSEQGNSVG